MARIFDGIVVVDLSTNLAGPSATALLSDHGAEVIKVEKPDGDDNRKWSPFREGRGVTGMPFNRDKKSIVVDLKTPEGIELVKEMVKKADVFVETFRPGTIDRMGLGYEELKKIKPDLIFCSISGFGQTGPYRLKPGYDVIAQAISGYMSNNGFKGGPPVKNGNAVADWTAGFNAFAAIASCLFYRERTGIGQQIDISLLDCLVSINEYINTTINGFEMPYRLGNHQAYIAPYGIFNGNDGAIVIAAVSDRIWEQLCGVMHMEELVHEPKFDSSGLRAEKQVELAGIIEDWMKTFDSVDDVLALLEEKQIPCCKVNNNAQAGEDPQVLARNMIVELKTKELSSGSIKCTGTAIKLSKTPGKMEYTPMLNENEEEVLKGYLGYDDEKIAELRAKGAVI